jgi:farnesyl-diphosphate farnesyltransferase
MAVKTVGLAYGNDAMFETDEEVKISRADVEAVISRCVASCTDDASLRADYQAMWTPVSKVTVAPAAAGPWLRGAGAP